MCRNYECFYYASIEVIQLMFMFEFSTNVYVSFKVNYKTTCSIHLLKGVCDHSHIIQLSVGNYVDEKKKFCTFCLNVSRPCSYYYEITLGKFLIYALIFVFTA